MDHKELGTNSSVGAGVNDGSTKFVHNSPTVHPSRNKSYDAGSHSLGKVDATAARPCAIIGPDRVLPPNPDDTMYLKKMPGEAWPPPENVYRRPPDYPSKMGDYQPTRNISPRQTFQENMQRIMVPPTFSSMKSSDESNLKNTKPNMPQEVKYCDVPYNVNSVNSEHKSVRNNDIPMPNVNHSYSRNMPPPYGWPTGVNVRPLRPYAAPDFYQYQEFPSCAGPRPLTMIRPHRPLHEESTQVYSERLYQDANIRFKPYPTVKEKHQQPRYDYASNYPSTFHPPASLPPHKYDLQKTIHGHPYHVYPPVPFKYLDRRIHEPFVDGYHRSHSQQVNFNTYHSQVVPPPYGPIPGNCMQNKAYSDASSKPMNVNKIQFENNNKVYLNLEPRNKNYSVPENLYYSDMNHSQAMRGEIILPTHSTLNIPPMSQHSIYRKDNTPLTPYDYNSNYRIFDQSINVNHSLQRLPLQFSPNTVSPSDSNTSNDTAHTIGTSQEDCGYVSQSSSASIRSLDSGNMPMPHEIYRRHSYNNYDMIRNTFHHMGPVQLPKNKTSSSSKKNLDVRQFLQMWNEGDEEVSEGNKDPAAHIHVKKISSQSETINNQEQLYVLGLVNVPSEELDKYEHIQKISKLPENIKGYNSIEILNQFEELLEKPLVSNYNRPREYNNFLKSQIDKEITTKMPRPVSPLDVEAKISQSVIHKEVGCNFEIKPCSPEMLNVGVAAPMQNVLGERMIEKVVNPITTKSPNLNRGEIKNTVNDEVKVASCKMISDQYSPNNSPKSTKPINYSVQDLERNAGLCLASLPQLDNDIELNFPEINQQFIKANQTEPNVRSGLQTFPHMDLQQTHGLPHETKNDPRQQNPHQLALVSVSDKEGPKLSKYRKGRKCEVNNSFNIPKQDTVKSDECTAALQRIDSVIIKNPDIIKSQDNASVNTAIEINYSFQKEPKQSYSEYINMEIQDLSCDTAIDFSLNKTEEETAVSYLNAIDKNINGNFPPPLEDFDEDCLNEDDDMALTSGSIKVQNTSEKLSIKHDELVEDPQSERPQFKITEEYKNTNQEIDEKKCESLIKVPVKSSKLNLGNKDCNVLITSKLTNAEPKISLEENLTSEENKETPEHNIQDTSTSCQELIEENLAIKYPKDVLLQSKYKIDIEKVEPELADESQTEIDLSSSMKLDREKSEEYNNDECRMGRKNEVVSEISSFTKTGNDSKDISDNPSIEEVLNDLSDQDSDKLDTKISSSCSTIENDICEDFTASNNFLRKNEVEFIEILSNSETNNENIGIVLEKTDIGIKSCKDNYVDIYQPVTRESNINNEESAAVVVSEQDPEQILKNSSDNMSSYSEEIDCVKSETDLQELATKIEECNPQTVLKSPVELTQLDNNVQMVVPEFECLSDNNFINNSDSDKTVLSITTETSSEETKSIQNDYVKKLDLSHVNCLSNELNPNCNIQNETCICKDGMENVTSALKLEESKIPIKTSTTMEQKKDEKYKDLDESESFFDKGDELAYTFEESSLSVSKSLSENTDVKISELKQDTEAERLLETNYETNIEKAASEFLADKSCISANTIEKTNLCFKNKGTILSKETDVERHLQTDYDTTNVFKKPCLSPKNVTYSENLGLTTTECGHDIEMDDDNIQNYQMRMDIGESEFLSDKSYINLIKPVEEFLNSSNEIIGETSAVISLECRPKLETDSSILKDFKSCVDKAESERLPYFDSPNSIEENCLGICNETLEHSIGVKEESKKSIEINEINDNEVASVVIVNDFKSCVDKAESERLPYFDSPNSIEESCLGICNETLEHSIVVKEESKKSIEINEINDNVLASVVILKDFKSCVDKAESESLPYFNSPNSIEESCLGICNETLEHSIVVKEESKKSIEINEINDNELATVVKLDNMNDPDVIYHTSVFSGTGPTTCQKELFSPRFQKLLMFTEGICKSIKNKQDDNFDNNIGELKDDTLVNQNNELVLSENNNIDALISRDNELCDFDKEAHLSNVMHISNQVLQSEHDKEHITEQNSVNLEEKCEGFKNVDTKLLLAEIGNSTVKPRKITKRSLSESALETYKDDDNDFVQPCKRKKCIKENQSFLESHMIPEDICNIIQTNRRNSISTFYNEDNVYIVIDNDLILTEETDGLDKICYTENTEEFLTSIESSNCEMNLNLDTVLCTDKSNQVCEYANSVHHSEEKSVDDWVDDVACIETVFSEDVAENIIIDVHASPKRTNSNSLDLESVDEETTVFYDSEHIDKLKSIYGPTICNDNTQLIETLYRTPQMNVNKTLYHIESQDSEECLDAINDSYLESNEDINCTKFMNEKEFILETGISSLKVFDNKQKSSQNLSLHSQSNQNIYPNFNHDSDFKFEELSIDGQENKFTTHSCESSNDYLTSNVPKENSSYSCSSSPEVSSTTSEEKTSSIFLKITNCNGSRVSQINEMRTDSINKLSYKLTEKREYQSYSSNFSSPRTLITKAAQKYIPPLKESIYDLKVKLPLPQHRLHTLKQQKIAKVEPKVDATANICTVKRLNNDVSKKQKPKFEDVLKSIDEINFKRHKDNMKKGKISIPKVIIKKSQNGAHYASSKSINRKETYNPDLTGRKWQPWVFLEKNNFIDKMALQNKAKAVYCHRKNSYVLLEKFRKYKSVYNASFVISQPKSETKGNLKYTIRLKHN